MIIIALNLVHRYVEVRGTAYSFIFYIYNSFIILLITYVCTYVLYIF